METPSKFLRRKHLENVSKVSQQLTIPASPYLQKLGFGTGVNVWKLERSPSGKTQSPWAIKRLSRVAREQKGNEIYDIRLKAEAEILRKLSHPNIIGFRAFEKTEEGVNSLALECCTTCLGTILEERHDDDLGPLPANEIWRVITDISNALKYLHDEVKLLHGDLKSFNVLVKGDFEICKLCDFGVSLPLNEEGVIENPEIEYVGTQIWSAPEIIDGDPIICPKSDIFSFGLIIYETIALVPPHTLGALNETEESKENSDVNVLGESMDLSTISDAFGTRPPLPESFEISDDYKRIIELFYVCTNELPEDRPSASAIYDIACSIKNNDSQNSNN